MRNAETDAQQEKMLYREGKYTEALEILSKKKTDTIETLQLKALCKKETGEYEDAVSDIKGALRLCPTSAKLWETYGIVCGAKGDFLQAEKAYKNGLKHAPDAKELMRSISSLKILREDWEGLVSVEAEWKAKGAYNVVSELCLSFGAFMLGRKEDAHRHLACFTKEHFLIDETTGSEERKQIVAKSKRELIKYECQLLYDLGKYTEVLGLPKDKEDRIQDCLFVKEMKQRCLMETGQREHGLKIAAELVKENPYCLEYVKNGWVCFKSEGHGEMELYEKEMEEACPAAASTLERFCFSQAGQDTPAFERRAVSFVLRLLRKNSLSLYSLLTDTINHSTEKLFRVCEIMETTDAIRKYKDTTSYAYFFANVSELKGNHSDALRRCEEILRKDSRCVEAKLLLASRYSELGETAMSIETARSALEDDPGQRDVRVMLARYQIRAGKHREALGTLFEGRDISEEEMELELKYTQAWWYFHELGMYFEGIGDIETAVSFYRTNTDAAEEVSRPSPIVWNLFREVRICDAIRFCQEKAAVYTDELCLKSVHRLLEIESAGAARGAVEKQL
ncbi:MAG: N-terminal acetyltransferase A auxiliary subunit [Amphiamblys sp. WSBS2006]|nr:MAG: N-terminal acetyltransferase A auxiliary subunit [Amphiamblys sp. WSBS2006]